ncbi:branched-chain amino acid ABC transporter substrate-binding protein [Carboxydochorda subterranea]|uniref:Branched-chain amino acid ABC transporter substrate-binding protein n=1 Tax=Carboxydichorda subterranea TaxID=3109565 RepID=A0ABZ1BYG1_9FIRM|nr:branched-chain amino acid ABC transporter substrate-binding protein [Limnochorda sp. L945t]WRP17844.1 branched-chain amino acid ABC transporter substrate-binding protein [Limnochorda sp. L945t]
MDRSLRVMFLAWVLLVVAAAPAALAAEPIRIGIQGPMSGQWAYEGDGFVKAITLLAEQINAKGGLLGRPIQIVTADDQSDPVQAAVAAQRLVSQGVVAVVGSYASSLTEPASTIYDEAGIVHITPSSTATRLSQKGYPRFFRTCFLDDRQGLFAADFITGTLKKKRVAIIHDNSTYASGLADWTRKYLDERGAQVVFYDAITPGERDFTATLTRVRAANPEVIWFTGYFPEGGLLVKQARSLGIKATFMAGNATNNPEFVRIAGVDAAKGSVIVTEPIPSDLPYPEARQFLADYQKKYGEEPASIWTLMAADAFRVIVEAIRQTKSTDPGQIATYLHRSLKDYPGITGPIQGFDQNGDRLGTIHKAYVVNEKGQIVPYQG